MRCDQTECAILVLSANVARQSSLDDLAWVLLCNAGVLWTTGDLPTNTAQQLKLLLASQP